MPARWMAVFVALWVVGCGPDRGAVREWEPSDHDAPPGGVPSGPTTRPPAANDAGSLVELAWRKNCVPCHGALGRGDGPQGAMVNAPDLTRPAFLAGLTDAQMATSIREGKNRMPGFDLPPVVVEGLVRRIRAAAPPP